MQIKRFLRFPAMLALMVGLMLIFGQQAAWTQAAFDWSQATPSASPAGRCCAGGVYDLSSSTVVIFGGGNGGCGGNITFGDTWTWDGSTWTQQAPLTSPPSRASEAMADNVVGGTVLLFGGQNSSVSPTITYNDTWLWDGANWVQQFPATSPSPRSNPFPAMVHDRSTHTVVLFGGMDPNLNALGDTWTWDRKTWTQQFPATSPPARFNHAMAYDPRTKTVVVFGGQATFSATSTFDDTWTWDGANWTQQFPSASPPARANASMTYDMKLRSVVLSGGAALPFGSAFYSDTWAWDGTNWTQLSPATVPPDRYAATMAYDIANQSAVLFGGFSSGCQRNDTWVGTR